MIATPTYSHYYGKSESDYWKKEFIRPIKDLLLMQRKGEFLTPGEKARIKKYAEEQRRKKK